VAASSQPSPARLAIEAHTARQRRQQTADEQLQIEQAITDETARQTEARHAARLEDQRTEDELTGDQAADALSRALRGIKRAHDDVWPF
jgi:hypothetical protein